MGMDQLGGSNPQCMDSLNLADTNPRLCGFDPKSTACGLAGHTGINPRCVDSIQNPRLCGLHSKSTVRGLAGPLT
jgi:hypothetical protein